MKLVPIIILLILLQLTIIVLDGSFNDNSYNLNPYNSTANVNNTENFIWDFVSDPTDWGSTDFLNFWTLIGALGVGAAISTAIGLIIKSDMLILSGASVLLFGVGAIPIISLYQVITREAAVFGCTTMPCAPGIIIWILTGGLLGLIYVMAVIEWWTARQTS